MGSGQKQSKEFRQMKTPATAGVLNRVSELLNEARTFFQNNPDSE